MNREELLAAVTAEQLDGRWFPTPTKTADDVLHRSDGRVWIRGYRSTRAPGDTRTSQQLTGKVHDERVSHPSPGTPVCENESGPGGASTPLCRGLPINNLESR